MDKRIRHCDKEFYDFIVGCGKGFLNPHEVESIIRLFEGEFSRHFFNSSSLANLFRIIQSIFDTSFFLRESINYPHHIEIITAIASNSNYLTDIVVRNPENIYRLFNNEYLETAINKEALELEIKNGLKRYEKFESKLNYIRMVKRRNILKIGCMDILKISAFHNTLKYLTVLAQVINENLFNACYENILNNYSLKKIKYRYCLVALGKLGGNELNYSSDIDLMVIFDKNSKLRTAGNVEYYQILSEVIQLFTKSASDITDKGHVYRIDFRLRPDGRTSPLCRTLTDTIKYYEVRGEDWERQMLIKMDFISGSRDLFNSFSQFADSYIYRSSFKESPLALIRRMKSNIESHEPAKDNVKTFAGGIRDIEFSVQALQLLYGKRNPTIKTGNTLEGITVLNEAEIISPSESRILTEAYIFYRKVEHYLQLMNNIQTHSLPDEKSQLAKLSHFLGFTSTNLFAEKVEDFKKKVRKIFLSVTGESSKTKIISGQVEFIHQREAEKNLSYLETGMGLLEQKQFDTRTINLFGEFKPALNQFLKLSKFPDDTLNNFVKIVRDLTFPSQLYSEFSDINFLKSFLNLCEKSERFTEIITMNKSALDLFVTRKVFTKNIPALYAELNFEQFLFTLTVQITLGLITAEEFGYHLSSFVEHTIAEESQKMNIPYGYFIAGLGSFGNYELNYTSDIDLIIIVDNPELVSQAEKDFVKLIEILRKKLPGKEIDLKLRPEGKSSQLIWDKSNYQKYLQERARIWELQSLLKIRFIHGNKKLFKSIAACIIDVINSKNIDEIKSEINSMHRKVTQLSVNNSIQRNDLKTTPGGIFTHDFIIQRKIFENGIYDQIFSRKESISLLCGELINSEKILNNYFELKKTVLNLQNFLGQNNYRIPIDETALNKFAVLSGFKHKTEFELKIKNILQSGIKEINSV
ncbi:MAG: hypothetical protein KKD86_03230 [Bacteroidetes bacterium]|nr:hypothetical protein [Bacteroidota bacterium]